MRLLFELMAWLRKSGGVLIVITAAVLLELLSGAHYYLTRRLMAGELEKRAESELTLKAILIKSTLNASENVLNSHLWDIRRSLSHPDSAFLAVTRMVRFNRNLKGGGVGFVPDFYPSEGRLYELYSSWDDKHATTVQTRQIGGENHDYTKRAFWTEAIAADGKGVWVDPYIDNEGAGGLVTSYAAAIRDDSDSLAAVAAIDVALDWLRDTIDHRHLYPSSFVMLLTEDGKPIIQPSEKRVSVETTAHVITLIKDSTVTSRRSNSGRSRVAHFEIDDRDGIVFFAHMKGKPHWLLAVVCYDDEVYASLTSLRLWFLLLMMVAFGILLYVIWSYARNTKRLQKKTLDEERIMGELRIASSIQQALLPTKEAGGCEMDERVKVEGRLIPAKAVGGDLYNVFVRDEKLFFCIGDVSGKGIPAALIMAITQTLFHNVGSSLNNPAHIMKQLNNEACRNNESNMFATLFIGVLDLPTGRLRYCNAGHEVPVVISGGQPAANVELLDAKANLPIGLMEDFGYEMQETTMLPGSTLFLYTDGLTEARNAQRKLFGRERVMQLVRAWNREDSLVSAVIAQVAQFSENTEQSDDLTLLTISYTPVEQPVTLDEWLTLKNDVKEVSVLSAFIKDLMGRLDVGKPLSSKLRLALEEAVVNVMEYAYPAGSEGEVDIHVTSDGRRLKFTITDSGTFFDPTEAARVDTTLTVDERPVGGLGILLVRELMDTINYERIDGKNVLTLTKTIK